MKQFLYFLILIGCSATTVNAQDKVYNNFIDTVSSPGREIYHLWCNYVNSKTGSVNASKYWDEADVKKYKAYDILLSWGCGGTYSTVSHVLKIKEIDKNIYLLKVGMTYDANELGGILQFIVKKENGEYKLSNYLPYNTGNWKHYSTGLLTFYYPDDYPINIADAKKSEAFLNKAFKDFDIKAYPISFYAAKGFSDMEEAAGYESFFHNGVNNAGACFDRRNHLIFSGEGFYHPHELIHIINAQFPKAHSIFLSGYAGLVGGHFGKPESYHQPRVLDYMETHADSIKNIVDFYYMDPYTNPTYVIGGLFCEEAVRLGGYDKLKKLFSYGTEDADFYTAIEKEFGISKDKVIPYVIEKLKDPKLFAKYDKL